MSSRVIFFTGGVFSSVGKGLTLANVGRIFKELGYKISALKFDPYLNVDSGNLSPDQHGEVYVTADGHETDLDLGHYERFMDYELSRFSCITAGKIFERILSKQRSGEFSGQTIQVVPHLIDEIHGAIYDLLEKESDSDFLFIEIGGTVGDIESLPFIEAACAFRHRYGRDNVLFIHISPILHLTTSGENKTKPTQHSIRQLASNNIFPDLLILRTSSPIPDSLKEKISLISQIKREDILVCPDSKNIYLIAESLYDEGIHEKILSRFNMPLPEGNLDSWRENTSKILVPRDRSVSVALIGKYSSPEAYLSIIESLKLASYSMEIEVSIDCPSAEDIEIPDSLEDYDAICIPYGFGVRGTEEKMQAISYCREHDVPFLGICFGMQLAVIEYARTELGMEGAHSQELDPDARPPLFIPNPEEEMRLGRNYIWLEEGTLAHDLFGDTQIESRHRHRYRFNWDFESLFEGTELIFSGFGEDGEGNDVLEIVELCNHPFFIGVQFHPEFDTRFLKVSPLFTEFLRAALERKYEEA